MNILLLIGLLFVCTNVFSQTKIEKNVKYSTVGLKKDDAEFLRLKDTAQKHIGEFLNLLKHHGADVDHYRFVVKSDFVEGDKHEHMWSQVTGYGNGMLKAIFIDSPFFIKSIKNGDKIVIRKEIVEDWSVSKDNKSVAGDFSDKYLEGKQ